jgi:2,4-dienoyl-CoA reductase-like NADH-dependent reductase (Old Yellow Enzyme family)
MRFERLLGPGSIGTLELRNRMAMCPMGVNLTGDDAVAWFGARARGGVGLVIVGSVSIAHPIGSFDPRQIGCASDDDLPALRAISDEVRRHGAASAAQLVHGGSQALLDIAEGRPLLVPSRKRPPAPDELSAMLTDDELAATMAPFTAPTARMAALEATEDDVAEVVASFADAARRAVEAGFDAIELHAGHGYLLHAFLSPFTNRRIDRYGGDAAGRATLLVEVVRAVRAVVPTGFPVWARIGADERHREPAQHLDDALVAMGLGLDAGLDGLHVTTYAEPMVATGITDGHTPHVPGALLPLAASVRSALKVPVIAMGRLTPERAETALAEGAADIIAMGRPLIADPDLPNKLAAGRRDRVRPCAYQYRCISAIFTNEAVRCAVNPDAGREATASAVTAAAPRSILVAGGGPAGLEMARRLAGRGHRVHLHEQSRQLGGMLRIAEQADPDLLGLADWLVGAATDAGIEIVLDRRVSATDAAAFDVLVWAAGASWPFDELPALDGGPVAIIGDGKAAVSIALRTATGGRATTLHAPGTVLAPELGLPGRFRLVADTRAAGATIHLGAGTDIPISVRHDRETIDARRGRPRPLPSSLAPSLEVHVIGDASGTGGIAAALRAAADLAAVI